MERFEALTLKMARIAALALLLGAGMAVQPAHVMAQEETPAAEEAAADDAAADETAEAADGEAAEGEAAAEGEGAAEGEAADGEAAEGEGEEAMTEAAMEGPEATEEVIENPYGLNALWNEGDMVSKGTLMILLLMSVGSWYVIFTKLFEQQRLFEQSNKTARLFAPTDTLKDGVNALPQRNTFRQIAEEGYESAEQYRKGLSSEITLVEWVSAGLNHAIDRLNAKLQGGLALLATVGSTAPFVGLFGTVWGIYHALVAIGMSGQASIDKVAGPVGEALIMTAIGLAVAVPAVLGYNWLTRRNKAALARARMFANEVQLRVAAGRVA